MEAHRVRWNNEGPLEGGGSGSEMPTWVQTSYLLALPVCVLHMPLVNTQQTLSPPLQPALAGHCLCGVCCVGVGGRVGRWGGEAPERHARGFPEIQKRHRTPAFLGFHLEFHSLIHLGNSLMILFVVDRRQDTQVNKILSMAHLSRNIPPIHFIFPGFLNRLCLNRPLPSYLSIKIQVVSC